MRTSAHRDPQSSAEHRRIALALLVALLLHVPLFLAPGTWRFGSLSDATAPALELRIELQEGDDAKDATPRDAPSKVEQFSASVPEPRDVPEPSDVPEPIDVPEPSDVSMEGVDQRVADTEPLLEPGTPEPNELSASLDSALAQSASDIPDELMPVEPALAPPSDTVLATIAPAQERALTRRLTREARDLLDSGASLRNVTFEHDDREFAAVLTRDPAADGTRIERIVVDVTTRRGGERAHTSMQMKRLAFSHFTQLVDRWDPGVALHDDEIAGRFHSNSQILVTYDRKVAPRLLGKVSTARGVRIEETDWKGRPRRHRRLFTGGLETGAARIRLPEISLPLARGQATGNADVDVVSHDTLIVFRADGGYDSIELESRAETRRQLAPDRPTYIIGVPDTELHVRGVVNGSVTVYSPERIVVQGDLTYAQGLHTDVDDYLGLVSDGNVEIDRAEVTGPGDLEIHAAVYARKRFVVRNTNARDGGTLFMYGSLTAGSISETEPRYATRIEFDPRFERARPPGFPETDRYEIEAWDGRWKVAEAPERE